MLVVDTGIRGYGDTWIQYACSAVGCGPLDEGRAEWLCSGTVLGGSEDDGRVEYAADLEELSAHVCGSRGVCEGLYDRVWEKDFEREERVEGEEGDATVCKGGVVLSGSETPEFVKGHFKVEYGAVTSSEVLGSDEKREFGLGQVSQDGGHAVCEVVRGGLDHCLGTQGWTRGHGGVEDAVEETDVVGNFVDASEDVADTGVGEKGGDVCLPRCCECIRGGRR